MNKFFRKRFQRLAPHNNVMTVIDYAIKEGYIICMNCNNHVSITKQTGISVRGNRVETICPKCSGEVILGSW